MSSITVTERAVQIIRFHLLHAPLLHKLAQDFLCTMAAGCLETRRDGKEHCGSYLPIKGTTRTRALFAFVSDRDFVSATNCMALGSCSYFHLQGKASSLCYQKRKKIIRVSVLSDGHLGISPEGSRYTAGERTNIDMLLSEPEKNRFMLNLRQDSFRECYFV